MSRFRYMRLALMALPLLAGLGAGANAQPSRRDVVVIALDSAAQRNAMLYRRATGTDRDVIALSPGATPSDLSQALRLLELLDSNPAAAPTGNSVLAIRSERVTPARRPEAGAEHKRHGEYLSALRQSSRRQIAGFGNVRSVRISVPPS